MFKPKQRILSACMVVAAMLPAACAYGADDAVALRKANFGLELLTGCRQTFDTDTDGWAGISGTESITAESGAMKVTGGSGVSTSVGNAFYAASAPTGARYWTFEDSTKAEVCTNYSLEYGKWAGQSFSAGTKQWMKPAYIKAEDVYTKNVADADIADDGTLPAANNTNALPGKSSKNAMGLWFPAKKLYTGTLGQVIAVRTKLSRTMLGNAQAFSLSFDATTSTKYDQAVFACLRRPDNPSEIKDIASGTTCAVPFIEDESIAALGAINNSKWTGFTATLNITDDIFDDSGDTVLWIITRAKSAKDGNGKYNGLSRGQWVYFDNISLEPQIVEKEERYAFNCDISSSGGTIKAELTADGERTLWSESFTLTDGERKTIGGSFTLKNNDAFLLGENHGSLNAADNDRLKLKITGGTSFAIDNVTLVKNETDLSSIKGKAVSLYAEIFSSADKDGASLVCALADGSHTERKAVSLKKGVSSYLMSFTYPAAATSANTEYSVQTADGTRLTEKTYGARFFENGVNLVGSDADGASALKSFGAGEYLVEFAVSGITEAQSLTVTLAGISKSTEVTGDGVYAVTFALSADDINTLSENAFIEANGSITDITLKKVMNYE